MPEPLIVAICPTFRRPKLIPNVLAMFEAQTHPNKQLLIYDDGGTFDSQHGDGWEIMSESEREVSLGSKFHCLVWIATEMGADHIALFEDDDVYLPGYLAAHADALREGDVSQPWRVYSNDKDGKGTYRRVGAQGRFHGSWAFTADIYQKSDGYPVDDSHDFDMQLNGALRRTGATIVDTFKDRPIEYLYRWQTTGYQNGSGFGEAMYDVIGKSPTHPSVTVPGKILPAFDDETTKYYKELSDGVTSDSGECVAGRALQDGYDVAPARSEGRRD